MIFFNITFWVRTYLLMKCHLVQQMCQIVKNSDVRTTPFLVRTTPFFCPYNTMVISKFCVMDTIFSKFCVIAPNTYKYNFTGFFKCSRMIFSRIGIRTTPLVQCQYLLKFLIYSIYVKSSELRQLRSYIQTKLYQNQISYKSTRCNKPCKHPYNTTLWLIYIRVSSGVHPPYGSPSPPQPIECVNECFFQVSQIFDKYL